MRAHLWVIADNLLAPDSVEQNDPPAIRVRRLACEDFIRHDCSAWPFPRMQSIIVQSEWVHTPKGPRNRL
jgi:hypothetical protein